MKPYFETERGKLFHGDCLEVMKKLPENSIDTLITDPPYGLSFMGKKWDYDVPSIEIWKECLRVLKPGATALIFAGSRTQHRMAVNVEDAGFTLKDCIMWIYGSGFPKSTDISKQIDKRRGTDICQFAKYIKEKRELAGISKKEINKIFGYVAGCNWWEAKGDTFRYPNWKDYQKLKKILKLDNRYDENLKVHIGEKIGTTERGNAGFSKEQVPRPWKEKIGEKIDITAPATPEAELWNGWHSHGIKPAYEPILVCQVPNDGTYAQNALKHGVAGLNIDGGRIEVSAHDDIHAKNPHTKNKGENEVFGKYEGVKENYNPTKGRFPANIIFDESAATLLDQQSGVLTSGARSGITKGYDFYGTSNREHIAKCQASQGGASRFFYTAKASRAERNSSLWELENKPGGSNAKGYTQDVAKGTDRNRPTKNHHPTVKPLKLMEYLCNLTKTPTGGTVLDPFAGSGTTALACHTVMRPWVLIEREVKYCEIAAKRIEAAASQMSF